MLLWSMRGVLLVGLALLGCSPGTATRPARTSGDAEDVAPTADPAPRATDAGAHAPERPEARAPHATPGESWPFASAAAQGTVSAQGMVATDADLATQVGAQVLRDGGNAVDAAVAVAFALAVVYPQAGNLGGGGFAVVHRNTGSGELDRALDFRETAPQGASRDMFLGKDGKLTEASVVGHKASGVPGSVAGLWALHEWGGQRPWADLVAPAIRLARDGFAVGPNLAGSIAASAACLARFPASRRLYVPRGEALAEGALLKNPDLAVTLERIAKDGPKGFYTGPTARLIEKEMRRAGGLVLMKDLAAYEAKWREPVTFSYRGHRVVSMPLPSSGGLTMALMAGILEGYDMRAAGWGTTRGWHLLAEAMRRAFALRNQALGDPDFVEVDTARFLSRASADAARQTIRTDRATPSADVTPPPAESSDTTHFSVVDGQGNAVALTTTINTSFGSCVTVQGAGFLLNNEMDDFAAAPGQPNVFGLVQGENNAIKPGKRMLSSMSPTLVFDAQGKLLLVTGASGGPTIITGTFQIMLNVIDHGFDLARAMSLPRIHHQHLPDALGIEELGARTDVVQGLEGLGHAVKERPRNVGDAPSIWRGPNGWVGFGEPRRVGSNAAGPQ